MASKKDTKQEFMDAYRNMKTGMKKSFSKENLKAMGKKISEESKKPENQIAMAMLPAGKAIKGAKAAGKAIRKLKKPKLNNKFGTYKPSKKEQEELRKFLDLNNLD
jgi:hypothetical protein